MKKRPADLSFSIFYALWSILIYMVYLPQKNRGLALKGENSTEGHRAAPTSCSSMASTTTSVASSAFTHILHSPLEDLCWNNFPFFKICQKLYFYFWFSLSDWGSIGVPMTRWTLEKATNREEKWHVHVTLLM